MASTDFEAIKCAISKSVASHADYDRMTKNVFIFVCETFVAWQLLSMVVTRNTHVNIATLAGVILLFCTFITLRIYITSAVELEKHSKIIMDSEIDSESMHEIMTNLQKINRVIKKYNIGRKSVFIMNLISTFYTSIFIWVSVAALIRN